MTELKPIPNFPDYFADEKGKWTKTKPDFPCLLLTRNNFKGEWEYCFWILKKTLRDNEKGEECTFLGWFLGDGEEYGDLADLKADEYFVIPLQNNE